MRRLLFARLACAGTMVLTALLSAGMITRVSAQETGSVEATGREAGSVETDAILPDTLVFDSPRYWAAFDTLAKLNGVRAEDFRVDPAALELAGGYADRLNLQRYLMAAPLRAPATMESMARRLTREIRGWTPAPAAPRLRELAKLLGGEPGIIRGSDSLMTAAAEIPKLQRWEVRDLTSEGAVRIIDSAMALLYVGSGKRYQGRVREAVQREAASLDPRVVSSIADALVAVVYAADSRDRILEQSDLARGGFLGGKSKATAKAVLQQLEDAQPRTLEAQLDHAEFARRLDSIDMAALIAAALPLASKLDRVVNELPDPEDRVFHVEWSTPRGRVAVGGIGQNTYRGDYLFVLDLGGDDTYTGPGAVSGDQPVSVVVDAGGNDSYAPADSASVGPGGAVLGYATIYDLGDGRDEYVAVRCGGGFGFVGVGWIVDGGGDDRYAMGSWSEGAAARGIGLLIDSGGNDHYDCTGASVRRVQGFGGTRGAGALIDVTGDDEYLAGHPKDNTLSLEEQRPPGRVLSQGASMGMSLEESGGVGLLIDAAGRDAFRADGESQGAGASAGVGALIDLAGDDSYVAAGQGKGRAQGIGLLLDVSGDDEYESKSIWRGGPGIGTDLGLGVLADGSGDDLYREEVGLVCGSSSNGAGFFIDLSGTDEYALDPATIVGASFLASGADPLRALSHGVAVFLDLGGEDPHSAGLLERLIESRREHHSPTFAPRRCLGGALIGNRALPPLIQ